MAQIGIALGALGLVLAFMGFFPGLMGIPTGAGVGSVQFAAILIGFSLLDLGALIYARFTIYPRIASNLWQQVGVRLVLTGLVLSGMIGFADALGFGSHPPTNDQSSYFGGIQAFGVLLFLGISALGVLLYALMGPPPEDS
jgi:hypothetical protein